MQSVLHASQSSLALPIRPLPVWVGSLRSNSAETIPSKLKRITASRFQGTSARFQGHYALRNGSNSETLPSIRSTVADTYQEGFRNQNSFAKFVDDYSGGYSGKIIVRNTWAWISPARIIPPHSRTSKLPIVVAHQKPSRMPLSMAHSPFPIILLCFFCQCQLDTPMLTSLSHNICFLCYI